MTPQEYIKEMKTQLKRINGTLIDESDTLTFKELVVKNKANLTEANLTWANLAMADLARANLAGAGLTWANLAGADLTGAHLAGADLTGAHLAGAGLTWANLAGADLARADLDGACLARANLAGADLTGADLDYSAWPLWCGTYNVKVDKNIAAQLAMHFCWLACDDPKVKAAQDAVKSLAMKCGHWREK